MQLGGLLWQPAVAKGCLAPGDSEYPESRSTS